MCVRMFCAAGRFEIAGPGAGHVIQLGRANQTAGIQNRSGSSETENISGGEVSGAASNNARLWLPQRLFWDQLSALRTRGIYISVQF